jgi:transposase
LLIHWDGIACGDSIAYFVDECHVLGDTAVGYGWAPSDQRVTVLVNNTHDRQTYFGALQMLTGELVLAAYPTANGDTTVAFLNRLQKLHPGKRLLIFWDNASYHYQGDMHAFLDDVNAFREPHEWPVTCIRFAPYASEQNPIEHVWQIGKQSVRSLFHTMRSFSEIKEAFERIKDTVFTFADLSMYLSLCPENQQAI